jgi:hypothetical protein
MIWFSAWGPPCDPFQICSNSRLGWLCYGINYNRLRRSLLKNDFFEHQHEAPVPGKAQHTAAPLSPIVRAATSRELRHAEVSHRPRGLSPHRTSEARSRWRWQPSSPQTAT